MGNEDIIKAFTDYLAPKGCSVTRRIETGGEQPQTTVDFVHAGTDRRLEVAVSGGLTTVRIIKGKSHTRFTKVRSITPKGIADAIARVRRA